VSLVPASAVKLSDLTLALPGLLALDLLDTRLTSLDGLTGASGLRFLDLRGLTSKQVVSSVTLYVAVVVVVKRQVVLLYL
jgi:hypothetical protein